MKYGLAKKRDFTFKAIRSIWLVFSIILGAEVKRIYDFNFWIYAFSLTAIIMLGDYLISSFFKVRK